jgi:hypothetical protein
MAKREDLIKKMGEASYKLGCIQEKLSLIQQEHQKAQALVQQLKGQLDKQGKK